MLSKGARHSFKNNSYYSLKEEMSIVYYKFSTINIYEVLFFVWQSFH